MEKTFIANQVTIRKLAVLLVLSFLFLCGTVFLYIQKSKLLEEKEGLYKVAQEELIFSKNKEGLLQAKIAVMQSSSTSDFIKMHTQDSLILKLQKLVKTYENKLGKNGTVMIIQTEAIVDIKVPTKPQPQPTTINPTYEADFNLDNWVSGRILATVDSIGINLKFREELDLVLGRDKTGFLGLGKGKPFAQVTLHNPYNIVTDMKVYSVKDAPVKRFHIGPVAAYGVGNSFTPSIFVGIGVNYSLISF